MNYYVTTLRIVVILKTLSHHLLFILVIFVCDNSFGRK